MSDRIFRSPSFKNCFCSFILHFSGLITIRFVLDPALNLYFELTIRGTDSYRQKNPKKTTTREWEGMGVILPGVERDFPPVFSWDWDGKRFKFVMHFGNRR